MTVGTVGLVVAPFVMPLFQGADASAQAASGASGGQGSGAVNQTADTQTRASNASGAAADTAQVQSVQGAAYQAAGVQSAAATGAPASQATATQSRTGQILSQQGRGQPARLVAAGESASIQVINRRGGLVTVAQAPAAAGQAPKALALVPANAYTHKDLRLQPGALMLFFDQSRRAYVGEGYRVGRQAKQVVFLTTDPGKPIVAAIPKAPAATGPVTVTIRNRWSQPLSLALIPAGQGAAPVKAFDLPPGKVMQARFAAGIRLGVYDPAGGQWVGAFYDVRPGGAQSLDVPIASAAQASAAPASAVSAQSAATGGQRVAMIFENATNAPLDVFVQDGNTDPVFAFSVPPMSRARQESTIGLIWRVARGDTWLDAFRTSPEPEQLVRFPQ
ncbi:MAG: hypothetical protein H6934_04375 [Burkholderiaceae bacterium]|nr:hypothetical protein [Burkholderiaceae bacterium]